MIIGLMEAAGFAAPGVDRIAGTEEVWFAAETKSPTSARRRRRSMRGIIYTWVMRSTKALGEWVSW
jgi:hypothetical protein